MAPPSDRAVPYPPPAADDPAVRGGLHAPRRITEERPLNDSNLTLYAVRLDRLMTTYTSYLDGIGPKPTTDDPEFYRFVLGHFYAAEASYLKARHRDPEAHRVAADWVQRLRLLSDWLAAGLRDAGYTVPSETVPDRIRRLRAAEVGWREIAASNGCSTRTVQRRVGAAA